MATKKTKKDTVGLSAPWYIFAGTLTALFAPDEEITVVTPKDGDKEGVFTITIESSNSSKLAAIKKIVGEGREFGNITVVIEYSDKSADAITAKDIEAAFANNEYFVKLVEGETPYGFFEFPIVAKEVVQFYTDNLTDGYGNSNITVADALNNVLDPEKCIKGIVITTANGTEE